METYITGQIFKGLTEGDIWKVIGYALIFFLIWVEVHSLKKGIKDIRKDLVKSHGIMRREQKQVIVRLEKVESHLPDDNGVFARHNF
ncbi:hypothetical protein BdPhPhi1402_gp34 [Bdellovibrio phage phi1402]|uniref:hypothetical protein n=1 Tax=Bdellovibrio phage phi1402 TaxID=1035662 RepID=UPI000211A2E0|nr:hypothetical protein BdPhPhi1402_gp34 [Bdellovibrio phage phi1402]AEG42331.1 hypothetical protein [Bdellovibrio phage phi1402]